MKFPGTVTSPYGYVWVVQPTKEAPKWAALKCPKCGAGRAKPCIGISPACEWRWWFQTFQGCHLERLELPRGYRVETTRRRVPV